MQLSIRDASRFVVGAAIIRDMALKNSPSASITFDNVAAASLRQGQDGDGLRASIEKLADQESSWFRSTPPHTLATDRVMRTRAQEMATLNGLNAAVLATFQHGHEAVAGDPRALSALQDSYQSAIRAVDEMPGSTTERRTMLETLKAQCAEACGDSTFAEEELNQAQRTYLQRMMDERLSAYRTPSLERSDDLDL